MEAGLRRADLLDDVQHRGDAALRLVVAGDAIIPDGHEQTRRVIAAPVQDAATTATTRIVRGEVAEQRVAWLEVAPCHQEAQMVACAEERRRTRERNLERNELPARDRLHSAEGVLGLVGRAEILVEFAQGYPQPTGCHAVASVRSPLRFSTPTKMLASSASSNDIHTFSSIGPVSSASSSTLQVNVAAPCLRSNPVLPGSPILLRNVPPGPR